MFTVSKAILKMKRAVKRKQQVLCEGELESNYANFSSKYKIFCSRIMQKMVLNSRPSEKLEEMGHITQTVFGAVLFADISGFTRLSASLNVEELKFHINHYFSLLLGIIDNNHGDVIKFCGDAVIVMWPVDEDAEEGVKKAAVKLSAICALDLLGSCGTYNHKMGSDGVTVSLRLHCGIACGPIHCMCLGDRGRWEFLVSGSALRAVGAAEREASLGEVCMDGDCYEMVQDWFEAEEVGKDIFRLTGRVQGATTPQRTQRTSDASSTVLSKKFPGADCADRNTPQVNIAGVDGQEVDSTASCCEVPVRSESASGESKSSTSRREKRKSTFHYAVHRIASVMSLVPSYSNDSSASNRLSFSTTEKNASEHNLMSLGGQRLFSGPDSADHIRAALQINADTNVARVVNFLSPANAVIDVLGSSGGEAVATNLRLFVPEAARFAIEGNVMVNLAELRVVATLFLQVLGLEDSFDAGDAVKPQKVISIVMSCLVRFQGSMRQYVVDDKGCVVIAAFGLPGSAHEDNCFRAIETAVRIRHLLNKEGIDCKVGITQGRVYCGLVGCGTRCEYAMMGSSVNLAARFMAQAVANEIIVGSEIYQDCVNDFRFTTLPKVKAKGYTRPVAAYAPIERLRNGGILPLEDNELAGAVIDRKVELQMLINGFEDFMSNGNRHFFLVGGVAGIGKSWLFTQFHRFVDKRFGTNKAIVYVATAYHTKSRYFCMRHIFDHILSLDSLKNERNGHSDHTSMKNTSTESAQATSKKLISVSPSLVGADAQQEWTEIRTRALINWMATHVGDVRVRDLDVDPDVYELENKRRAESPRSDVDCSPLDLNERCLSGETKIMQLIPLLEPVIPIDVDQTELCRSISHWARTKLCFAIILKIMKATVLSGDRVLMIENLHLCDLLSLEILSKLLESADSGFFLSTLRSQINQAHLGKADKGNHGVTHQDLTSGTADLSESAGSSQQLLLQISQLCTPCNLHPLSATDILNMVETVIPERFLRANPELIKPNSITQIILRTDGKPYLTSAFILTLKDSLVNGNYRGLEFLPSNEQNIIVNRFDKLDAKEQMILKISSVIGDSFYLEFLSSVLKYMGGEMSAWIIELETILSKLVRSTLIVHIAQLILEGDEDLDEDFSPSDVYQFSTKNVRYSIYNLMLISQRESAHAIVAKILEKKKGQFDLTCKHYFRSNNIPKKLHYLHESLYRSHMDNDLHAMKMLLSRLLTIATGDNVDVMISFCCSRKYDKNGKEVEGPTVDIFGRMVALRGQSVEEWVGKKKWIEHRDIQRKVDVLSLPQENVQKVKDEPFAYHSHPRRASASVFSEGLRASCTEQSWLSVPITTIDREIVALWIGQLAGVEFRLGHIRRSHNLCVLSQANLGVKAIDVKDNGTSSSMYYRIKECLADIHGISRFRHPSSALEHVKTNVILAQTYLLKGQLMSASAALHLAARVRFPSMSAETISIKIHLNVLELLVSSLQGEPRYRVLNRVQQLEKHFVTETANSECRGVFHLVKSILDFSSGDVDGSLLSSTRASIYFERAESLMLLYGNIVHRGWLHLLSGKFSCTDRIIKEATQLTQIGGVSEILGKWVIELKVVYNICRGDWNQAYADWEQLKVVGKKDSHTATASALGAYILLQRYEFVDAALLARYACSRLSQKIVTSVISGVFLFFAGYSALVVIDDVSKQLDNIKDPSIQYGGKDYSMWSTGSSTGATRQTIVSVLAGQRTVSQLQESADTVVEALKRATCHIPVLAVLLDTLCVMRQRVRSRSGCQVELTEINMFQFGWAFYNVERANNFELLGEKFAKEALEARAQAYKFFEESVGSSSDGSLI